MKSSLKTILLGIAIILFGIAIKVLGIGYTYSSFAGYLMNICVLFGLIVSVAGFFVQDESNDCIEKIYDAVLKIKNNSSKIHTCEKCGCEYSEDYNYCPHCGHRE